MLVILLSYLMAFLLPFTPIINANNEKKYVEPVKDAIVQKDADAFVDLLSYWLIDANPGIEDGIEEMMDSIEGDVTEITYDKPSYTAGDVIGTTCYDRYIYTVTTTQDTYTIYLTYCTMSLFDKKELGINRVAFMLDTDENGSKIIDPDLYFTDGSDCYDGYTRIIRNAKGTLEARELFPIADDGSSVNVRCYVKQPSGLVIKDENMVKVWIIPEGEEMTEERRQNPTFTIGGPDNEFASTGTKLEAGNYWLYAESNNSDLTYNITISALI